MMHQYFLINMLLFTLLLGCQSNAQDSSAEQVSPVAAAPVVKTSYIPYDSTWNTIHIYVALCDNQYQGIVPVPEKIGNGQDPDNNLYWGCGYGIRTYFKRSKEWQLLKTQKTDSIRLERLVFRHIEKDYYLVADAYNGKYIRQCTEDFLNSSSGQLTDTSQVDDKILGIAGNARLVAYIGHDGLMDFNLTETYDNTDGRTRDAIVLACYSKSYFEPYLQAAGANPLIWTTGLMCPEAYTVHDAITGYVNGDSDEAIRARAALAYAKYQKCSERAAKNLLVTGW